MSDGRPTALVRDGDTEGNDPAPDEPYREEPVPAPSHGIAAGPADLRRADDAQQEPPFDSKAASRRAVDIVIDQGFIT